MELRIVYKNVSKEDIRSQALDIINEVIAGEIDPLKAFIAAKANIEAWTMIAEEIKGYALDEAEKYKNNETVMGASFRLGYTGDRYDYEQDKTYRDLKEQLKKREELLKQASQTKAVLVDDETGEQIPKVDIKTWSKQTLSVSFK